MALRQTPSTLPVSGQTHADASGTFFKLNKEAAPPKGSMDVTKQEQLWEASMNLAGQGGNG